MTTMVYPTPPGEMWPWTMLTDGLSRFALIGRHDDEYGYQVGRLPQRDHSRSGTPEKEPGDDESDSERAPVTLLARGRLALERDRDADEYGRGDQFHVFRRGQWLLTDLDQLDPH